MWWACRLRGHDIWKPGFGVRGLVTSLSEGSFDLFFSGDCCSLLWLSSRSVPVEPLLLYGWITRYGRSVRNLKFVSALTCADMPTQSAHISHYFALVSPFIYSSVSQQRR